MIGSNTTEWKSFVVMAACLYFFFKSFGGLRGSYGQTLNHIHKFSIILACLLFALRHCCSMLMPLFREYTIGMKHMFNFWEMR